MDKKIAGLIGAVASVAMGAPVQASTASAAETPEAMQPASYADLLEPIPNAIELLKADDQARAEKEAAEMQLAQGYYYPYPNYGVPYYDYGYRDYGYRPYYYHHHHHHHHYYHHHHHHHHHHQGAVIGVPGFGAVEIR